MFKQLCGFEIGLNKPFFLIAGPCVIESEQFSIDTAGEIKAICAELNIPFIYKSSFIKQIAHPVPHFGDWAWKRA